MKIALHKILIDRDPGRPFGPRETVLFETTEAEEANGDHTQPPSENPEDLD